MDVRAYTHEDRKAFGVSVYTHTSSHFRPKPHKRDRGDQPRALLRRHLHTHTHLHTPTPRPPRESAGLTLVSCPPTGAVYTLVKTEETNHVRFFDDTTFEAVGHYELRPMEMACSIVRCSLAK